MASKRAALADAIANALQSAPPGTFAQTFAVNRKYVPAEDLKNLRALTVTVCPLGAEKRSSFTRRQTRKDFSVEIGVQKKLSPSTDPEASGGNAEIDGLCEFCEQVADYFELTNPNHPTLRINGDDAKWASTEIDPPYDLEHLRTLRVFTSLIVLTYFYF